MENQLEINRIAYNIVKTQIEFGTYGYGEQLPPIEDMAENLFVSLDTARHAYHRLQEIGYITLSKRIGTIVSVHYTREETQQHIQTFFSAHKDTILDICRSMPVLMSGVQLAAWQHMTPEHMAKFKEYLTKRQLPLPYLAIHCLQLVYSSLNNDLLTGLIRKLNIIYMLPFLGLKDYETFMDGSFDAYTDKFDFYKRNDWPALHASIIRSMNTHNQSVQQFYATRIAAPAPEAQIPFVWSSYKKASQICYSVGLDILDAISQGDYSTGSFLPSLQCLAEQKKVSVSTMRNVIGLLNALGIVKTINGVGTQVLSMEQAKDTCDWSSPTVRKRLLDYKQSLQIILLSCQEVAAQTISEMDTESKQKWLNQLYTYERLGKLDLVSPFSIKMIAEYSPSVTIRTVYKELHNQLLWGVPLRGLLGAQETVNESFGAYHHAMVGYLEKSDAQAYALKLKELLSYAYDAITELLSTFGI